jgi:hypothetical protein
MPATPPVRKATFRAAGRDPALAAALKGQAHADEAGEARHEAAGQEGQGAEDARLGEGQGRAGVRLEHLGGGGEDDDRQGDEDEADRAELPLEVGHGPLLDGLGDLLHLGRALIGGQHALHEGEADEDGQQGGGDGEEQPGELSALEGEDLVAALRGEEIDHAGESSMSMVSIRSGSFFT